MEVNFETLDFIKPQLTQARSPLKSLSDDADLPLPKGFKNATNQMSLLSAGNPEPKATGNIVQDQLDRLKDPWERVATTIAGAMSKCPSQLHTLLLR